MALARISVTVPKALVAAADRRARALGRSRSWVLADALRAYLEAAASGESSGASAGAVREPVRSPAYLRPGLGEHRQRQLESDLKLTPEQRVAAAEDTARLARPRLRYRQTLQFDRYEDFLAWKRHADLAP